MTEPRFRVVTDPRGHHIVQDRDRGDYQVAIFATWFLQHADNMAADLNVRALAEAIEYSGWDAAVEQVKAAETVGEAS